GQPVRAGAGVLGVARLGVKVSLPMPQPAYEPDEDPEVLEWWSLTPAQRYVESGRLWATYLALGGSLDPEADWQSPFYDPQTSGPGLADGRSGVHPVGRRRVQPRRGPGRSARRKKP